MAIIEENDKHQQHQPNEIEASPQSQSVFNQKHHHRTTLPTEILVEVLLKLPVEPILRCKSVCKLWFSLISDPHFVKSHLSLSVHNNRLIYSIGYGLIFKTCCFNDVMDGNFMNNAIEVVDYPFKYVGKPVMVVGSCNGLLCVDIFSPNDDILFIWNPSTRKYHTLPSDADRDADRECDTPVVFGFGYVEFSDDYKVVSVFRKLNKEDRFETFVKMYSLRNGSWKDIGAFPHGTPYMEDGKFVNGALHWLASDGNDHSTVISLDLALETFGEVMLHVADEGEIELTLGSLGEWLCVVCDYDQIRVDLWAMKFYGVKDSWTILVFISYIPDPEFNHLLDPLCISNDGKILLTFGKKLMIYDSKNNSSSDVQNFDDRVLASTFVESLVSPSSSCT